MCCGGDRCRRSTSLVEEMNEQDHNREIEQTLLQIEDLVEGESGEGRKNRIGVKNFLLFLMFGGEEKDEKILSRKVKSLLADPRTCAVVTLGEDSEENPSEDPSAESKEDPVASPTAKINGILESAGRDYVDVQDLNTVYVCPVLFAARVDKQRLTASIDEIDRFMKDKRKKTVWQPFLLLRDEVELYGNICNCFDFMTEFIAEKYSDYSAIVNRCCVLSSTADNGFYVEPDSLLQTVALVSVMQNAALRNPDELAAINGKIRVNENDTEKKNYFFTARAAAVVNPKLSYTLQRIFSAFQFFSGATDTSSEHALGKINYASIDEVVRPFRGKLPSRNGKITLYPIYGVMKSPEMEQNMRRLLNDLYLSPFFSKETSNALMESALRWFFKCYFENNGSLQKLKELIESGVLAAELEKAKSNVINPNGGAIRLVFDDIAWDNQKLKDIAAPYRGYADTVRQSVFKVPGELLGSISGALTNGSFRTRIDEMLNAFQNVERVVKNHLRIVQKSEIVIHVGMTAVRSSFAETEEGWIKDQSTNQSFQALNQKFDDGVRQMLFNVNGIGIRDLLMVCYGAVQGQCFRDEEYISRLSVEAGRNHSIVENHAGEINDNLRFTIRFLNRSSVDDFMCVVGDPENEFYKRLKEYYNGIGFGLTDFDRIDMLHISAPFELKEIDEWERIAEKGVNAGETAV